MVTTLFATLHEARGHAAAWLVRSALVLLTSCPHLLAAAEAYINPAPKMVWPGARISVQLVVESPRGEEINVQRIKQLAGTNCSITVNRRERRQSMEIINGVSRVRLSYGASLTIADEFSEADIANASEAITLPIITIVMADGSSVSTLPKTVALAQPDPDLVAPGCSRISWPDQPFAPGESIPVTISGYMPYDVYSNRGISPVLQAEGAILHELLPWRSSQLQESFSLPLGADGSPWFALHWTGDIEPQQSGEYQLNAEVLLTRNRTILERLQAKTTTLIVDDFPQTNQPNDFIGVVGPFTVSAQLNHDRCIVGEGVLYEITVSGENIHYIPQLRPQVPEGIDIHELRQQHGDNSSTWVYDLVPQKTGEFTKPALNFSWFDASTRTYQRTVSDDLTLTVFPGRLQSNQTPSLYDPRETIVLSPAAGSSRSQPGLAWFMLLLGFLLPLLVKAGLTLSKRWQQPPTALQALHQAAAAGEWDQCEQHLLYFKRQGAAVPESLLAAISEQRWGRDTSPTGTPATDLSEQIQQWHPTVAASAPTIEQEAVA